MSENKRTFKQQITLRMILYEIKLSKIKQIPYLSHVFQGSLSSGSRFFKVQVFQESGFLGSRFFRVWIQSPGLGFKSSQENEKFIFYFVTFMYICVIRFALCFTNSHVCRIYKRLFTKLQIQRLTATFFLINSFKHSNIIFPKKNNVTETR